VIEVTEQHTIGDPDVFARKLDALRERGFGLALDDYGSGFANLHLLMALKPEYLKLSGLFLKGIDTDPQRRTIVAATADMAQRLGIPVIVEWLETEAQMGVVADLGIPFAQGYYLAQPAPAASLLQSDMVSFEPSAATGTRS
jgi:EAL domain-containing protein (putative c-di-GMP-specific phosphodiesterase class I)